jgi:hypothetical protein
MYQLDHWYTLFMYIKDLGIAYQCTSVYQCTSCTSVYLSVPAVPVVPVCTSVYPNEIELLPDPETGLTTRNISCQKAKTVCSIGTQPFMPAV